MKTAQRGSPKECVIQLSDKLHELLSLCPYPSNFLGTSRRWWGIHPISASVPNEIYILHCLTQLTIKTQCGCYFHAVRRVAGRFTAGGAPFFTFFLSACWLSVSLSLDSSSITGEKGGARLSTEVASPAVTSLEAVSCVLTVDPSEAVADICRLVRRGPGLATSLVPLVATFLWVVSFEEAPTGCTTWLLDPGCIGIALSSSSNSTLDASLESAYQDISLASSTKHTSMNCIKQWISMLLIGNIVVEAILTFSM
jgi:hypothetical protein